jgi:hypothetical protein
LASPAFSCDLSVKSLTITLLIGFELCPLKSVCRLLLSRYHEEPRDAVISDSSIFVQLFAEQSTDNINALIGFFRIQSHHANTV